MTHAQHAFSVTQMLDAEMHGLMIRRVAGARSAMLKRSSPVLIERKPNMLNALDSCETMRERERERDKER